MRDKRTVNWLGRLALAAALLALPAGALADPVSGRGAAVARNGAGDLVLDDGRVLRVTERTRVTDAAGRTIDPAGLRVAEGREEVPVRFRGDLQQGVVVADTLEVGVGMPD